MLISLRTDTTAPAYSNACAHRGRLRGPGAARRLTDLMAGLSDLDLMPASVLLIGGVFQDIGAVVEVNLASP